MTTPLWQLCLLIAACAYLGVMYHHGAAPSHQNLYQGSRGGVLTVAPGTIDSVDLKQGDAPVRLRKRVAQWTLAADNVQLTAAQVAGLAQALDLLHTAAPVRVIAPESLPVSRDETYGFSHDSLAVSLVSEHGVSLEIRFGGRANDGVLQYMRIKGRGELYLMSGFVGEVWRDLWQLLKNHQPPLVGDR